MKTSRFVTLVLAASMALPALAQAQPSASLTQVYQFGFNGPVNSGVTLNGTYVVGPYRAHEILPVAGSPFDMFCIDLDNSAKSLWNARVVTFADILSNAGGAGTAAAAALGSSVTTTKLRTAAYLSSKFASSPTNQWAAIHGEIWSMFSSNSAVAPFAAQAAADMANATIGGNAGWDGYDMLIDENAFANSCQLGCGQSFIVPDGNLNIRVVPEPSTYALMGAGLLAIGYIRRRRNNVA